jgi:hypothetical protein
VQLGPRDLKLGKLLDLIDRKLIDCLDRAERCQLGDEATGPLGGGIGGRCAGRSRRVLQRQDGEEAFLPARGGERHRLLLSQPAHVADADAADLHAAELDLCLAVERHRLADVLAGVGAPCSNHDPAH